MRENRRKRKNREMRSPFRGKEPSRTSRKKKYLSTGKGPLSHQIGVRVIGEGEWPKGVSDIVSGGGEFLKSAIGREKRRHC